MPLSYHIIHRGGSGNTKLETYIFASNNSTSSSSCVHIHTVHRHTHRGSGIHWIDDKCLNAISNAAWMNMNMHKSPQERVLINVDLDIHIASHHCLIVCQRLRVLSMAVALPIHPPSQNLNLKNANETTKKQKFELNVQFRHVCSVVGCHYRASATEIPSFGKLNLVNSMRMKTARRDARTIQSFSAVSIKSKKEF